MTIAGPGRVRIGEHLSARLAAAGGAAPVVTQHAVCWAIAPVGSPVGIARVLHLAPPIGGERGCGILWHGPIAVAQPAVFPGSYVMLRLAAAQQAALPAMLMAERRVACETRHSDQGVGVVARRLESQGLVMAWFGSTTPRVPGVPSGIAKARAQSVHYIATYQHRACARPVVTVRRAR